MLALAGLELRKEFFDALELVRVECVGWDGARAAIHEDARLAELLPQAICNLEFFLRAYQILFLCL